MIREGDTLGDYEVERALRAGGMASLFLGRRRGPAGFARHVAIKVVHTKLAQHRAFIEMFLDEARLSARIHHPNVVHVEQLGEASGHYYLVMEYVHGAALSQLLAALSRSKRALSPELAVWTAIQVADGLHAAHETTDETGKPLGVVHRDVSPQNVLLAYGGHVKLIDFGIAKAAGRLRATEGVGAIKGKVRYMAPEQAMGREVDRRADIWALGVVLWEMLTMRRLFAGGNDVEVLRRVRSPEQSIVAPSAFNPEVPPALDRAILRALAIDPMQRMATADELRCELADALPQSLTKRAQDLSRVMYAVMGDAIERERSVLPESLSQIAQEEPTEIQRSAAVDEHTMVLETVEYLTDDLPPHLHALAAEETRIPSVRSSESTPRRRSRALPLFLGAAVVAAAAITYVLAGTAPEDRPSPAMSARPPPPPASPAPLEEPEPEEEPGPVVAAVEEEPAVSLDAGVLEAEEPAADDRRARRRSKRVTSMARANMQADVDRVGGMPFIDDIGL